MLLRWYIHSFRVQIKLLGLVELLSETICTICPLHICVAGMCHPGRECSGLANLLMFLLFAAQGAMSGNLSGQSLCSSVWSSPGLGNRQQLTPMPAQGSRQLPALCLPQLVTSTWPEAAADAALLEKLLLP